MRSCPTWAMGNVLGVQGDKAILGHTGESDHFDHNLVIRDDDMMLLLTITMKMMRMVISNADANDDEGMNNDLVVLGGLVLGGLVLGGLVLEGLVLGGLVLGGKSLGPRPLGPSPWEFSPWGSGV